MVPRIVGMKEGGKSGSQTSMYLKDDGGAWCRLVDAVRWSMGWLNKTIGNNSERNVACRSIIVTVEGIQDSLDAIAAM